VTGGAQYWTGADEAQNVLEGHLPADLAWQHDRVRGENHNAIFATDALLTDYLRLPEHVQPADAARYRAILQGVLRMHGGASGKPLRFLDKSQTLSLRVGYLNKALKGCDPHFVLMLRNPFAMVWRAATGRGVIGQRPLPEAARLDLAIEHWRNLYRAALAQEPSTRMLVLRYEDFLAAPTATIKQVCTFADLAFAPAMMPQPAERMPLGSAPDARDGVKWYPIGPANNAKHLATLPEWARDRIAAGCADLIERFCYDAA